MIARRAALFFDDLLDAKVREFNPHYAEAEGTLLGKFRHLHTDIYGNRGNFSLTTTQIFIIGSRNTHLRHFGLQPMNNTLIEPEPPAELTAQARAFVAAGWATDFNELLAEALRRFLESHQASLTESFI